MVGQTVAYGGGLARCAALVQPGASSLSREKTFESGGCSHATTGAASCCLPPAQQQLTYTSPHSCWLNLVLRRAPGAVHSAAASAHSSRRRSAWRRIAAQSAATVTDVDTAAQAGDLAGPDALSSPPQLPPAGQLGQRPVPGQPGAAGTVPAAGADMVLGEASASSAAHPVALADCRTLPAQASLEAALVALQHAVAELPAESGAYASALLRLEVPVPRFPHPLWWLRGQAEPFSPATPDTAASAAAAAALCPRIYFSPRRTTAADTEGSAAASAAAAGAGSVAGCGAAWLWRGAPGQALDEAVVRNMQRFLAASAANLRVRAFGGARFNAAQAPAAEWAEFGSYCFLIPRCECVCCSVNRLRAQLNSLEDNALPVGPVCARWAVESKPVVCPCHCAAHC